MKCLYLVTRSSDPTSGQAMADDAAAPIVRGAALLLPMCGQRGSSGTHPRVQVTGDRTVLRS